MKLTPRRIAPLVLLALMALALMALAFAACGTKANARRGVLIEPLTATPRADVAASHATPKAAATAASAAAGETPAQDDATPDASVAAAAPTPAPAAVATDDALRPTEGRWIEVDVTKYVVRLMDGDTVLQTIGPVAVGEQVDTGVYESTQTGLFHVYNKAPGLAFDPPYNTYISDWVGFDPAKNNGFHSFLKDKDGNVVDASTGRVSNGCIRTPDPAAITAFAQDGMPVWVHA